MTPQEALTQALQTVLDGIPPEYPDQQRDILPSDAAAILAALPEGWFLIYARTNASALFDAGYEQGAQKERERLRATMAKWDGDDWHKLSWNSRIAMLLDHYADPLDPEDDR